MSVVPIHVIHGRNLTPIERHAWTTAKEMACELGGRHCCVTHMYRYAELPGCWIVTIEGVRGMGSRSFDIPVWP